MLGIWDNIWDNELAVGGEQVQAASRQGGALGGNSPSRDLPGLCLIGGAGQLAALWAHQANWVGSGTVALGAGQTPSSEAVSAGAAKREFRVQVAEHRRHHATVESLRPLGPSIRAALFVSGANAELCCGPVFRGCTFKASRPVLCMCCVHCIETILHTSVSNAL